MSDILLVFCTFPDIEKARLIGTTLIESQLAACVNLCPGIESIYRWQDKVESANEVLALIKATTSGYAALETRIRELHPYEVPEVVALPVHRALAAYAGWVQESVASSS